MQSLGVLLFYLCFQTLPFEGDCKLQVLHWLFAGILTSVSCNILARTVNTRADFMPSVRAGPERGFHLPIREATGACDAHKEHAEIVSCITA